MSFLVYVSGAALLFVVVMVFVNSRRVRELRDDINNIPAPQSLSAKDTSLETGLRGVAVPKSYYWVDVVDPVEVLADASDGVERASISLDISADTDSQKLIDDISTGRVTFVYRPERNRAYRVEPGQAGSSSFTVLKKAGSPDFISSTASLPDDGRITIIGLPEGVVAAQGE